ncbi:unannotated protein [freshwater metagenome]|uniref:Unannotated protein n=1 Tax=freshwater metagenome TaxID=449393 RepID=A0A6J7MAY3_9ZZZZ
MTLTDDGALQRAGSLEDCQTHRMLGEPNRLACLAGVAPTPRALNARECGAQFKDLLLVLGHGNGAADLVEDEFALPGTSGMRAVARFGELGLIGLHPTVHTGVE